MLLHTPNASLAGLPKQPPPVQKPDPQQPLGPDGAYLHTLKSLLPEGGSKVLNAPEVLVAQKSQKAADALVALLTPATLQAIPKVAASKYLGALKPLLQADKALRAQQLESFTARLRVWPILNQIYALAVNERDPVDQNGAHVVLDKVKELAAQASAQLPADDAQTTDVPHAQVAGLLDLVVKVKQAEVELLKEQCKGNAVTFALYEFNVGDDNTTQMIWGGPVAVNPRVALSVPAVPPDPAKPSFKPVNSKLLYPTPDSWILKAGGTPQNPEHFALVPGLASYQPLGQYEYNNGSGAADKGPSEFDTPVGDFTSNDWIVGTPPPMVKNMADADYKLAIELVNEQALRVTGKPLAALATSLSKAGGENPTKAGVPKYLYTPFTLGYAVDEALKIDPEWGGGALKNNKSQKWVLDNELAGVTKAHDLRRLQLMAKEGAWTNYCNAIEAVKGAIIAVCYFPPVPPKWALVGLTRILTPQADWKSWQDQVTIQDSVQYQNFAALLKQRSKSAWGKLLDDKATWLLYQTVVEELKDAASLAPQTLFGKWQGGKGMALPRPLVYTLDTTLASIHAQADKFAGESLAGASKDQIALIGLRSEGKAATLLAMRGAELAQNAQALTQDMIDTLIALADKLYGCKVSAPGGAVPKEEWIAYYDAQLAACANNPAPSSLAGKWLKMQADLALLKVKADAGSDEARQQMLALRGEMEEVRGEMADATNRRVSRRNRAVSNTTSEGGTLWQLGASAGALNLLGTLVGAIKLGDGTFVDVAPPADEKQAAQEAKNANDKTGGAAQGAMAYVVAAGEALKQLIAAFGLAVPPATLETIDSNTAVANTTLPTKKKSGSGWGWLLLALAAAVEAKRS